MPGTAKRSIAHRTVMKAAALIVAASVVAGTPRLSAEAQTSTTPYQQPTAAQTAYSYGYSYPYYYPYYYPYWTYAYPWGWGYPWGRGWPVGVSVAFGGCFNCGFRGAFFRPGFGRFGFAHPAFFHAGFGRFGFAHPGFGRFGFVHGGFGGSFHGGGRK